MTRTFLLLLSLLAAGNPLAAEVIRVTDDAGAAVGRFEAMYHTAEHGYSRWEVGREGSCRLDISTRERTPVDVLVRAEGYATVLKRFEDAKGMVSSDEEVRVTLTKGQPVKLRLEVPEGLKLGGDFVPESYFPHFASRVRMFWQPVNKREGRQFFNFLNLRPHGDGVFALNLADGEPNSFFIGIDQPGRLRFCELGPFTKKDVADSVIKVTLPLPAPIDVKFDTVGIQPGALPLDKVTCDVMWKDPDGSSGSYYSANDSRATLRNGTYRITDLAPASTLCSCVPGPGKWIPTRMRISRIPHGFSTSER